MMLNVYALQVPREICNERITELLTFVSIEKHERIKSFKRKEDALRTLFADLLVRYIILKERRIANHEIKFKYNRQGKPFLALDSSFSFNVSHSGEWVVAIAGNDEQVGIDIEKIRPIDMEIARRFFTNKEYVELCKQGEHNELMAINYFYDLWTLKECFLKAIGKGLTVPLDSFTIQRHAELERFSIVQSHSSYQYFFRQYDLDLAYKLSACATIDGFPKSIKRCNVSELYLFMVMIQKKER